MHAVKADRGAAQHASNLAVFVTFSILDDGGAHFGLRDDEGPQAVVPDGAGHCQDAHHAHAVPEQDLAARSLDTRLLGAHSLQCHCRAATCWCGIMTNSCPWHCRGGQRATNEAVVAQWLQPGQTRRNVLHNAKC